ncbi:baseplate J/gp47 family protein, partial [Xanthomonas sp. MUS 060]|uniref:baseplate J/gp47 family protein n=1 Tax=Xanthomonas sp. MUS 060 TaxID=1588031 RepID=UPI0031B616BF
MATYIDTVRPVTAHVTVYAPLAVPINFAIAGLSPNTLAVQQAIVAELADLLAREGQPGGTILLSHMRSAISSAAQEWDYVLLTPADHQRRIAQRPDPGHGQGGMAVMQQINQPLT